MPYTKQTWTDEVPSAAPIKYSITDDVEGAIASSAVIEVETPITAGSPVNAERLNYMEDGIETAQETAEVAQETANNAVQKPSNPSSTSLLQLSTAGMPSAREIQLTVQMQIADESTEVDTATGIGYFFIPSTMNGMNLVRAQAMVLVAGTTNSTTIQIRNLTKYPSNDALSVAINIASGATVGTAGTVNTSYDDIATNDKIKIYVVTNSTTKPKGLFVILEYKLP